MSMSTTGPKSMTGCGEATLTRDGGTCRVEVRSVNHRFFKLSLRAREGFSALEPQIDAAVRERLKRGSVQVTLDVSGRGAGGGRRIDRGQLETYLDDLADFCTSRGLAHPISVDALLSLPGVVTESFSTPEAIQAHWPLVEATLRAALDAVDGMRASEGAAMAADLRNTCGEIAGLASAIRKRVPKIMEDYRRRLFERVSRALAEHDAAIAPADVAREVALLADRSDIAEELVRLDSHVAQFTAILAADSPGRPLEFLTQELGREANTIGSKSADVEIAHTVVELKARVERLKELVQNFE